MCKVKKYRGTSNIKIDKCMKHLINFINRHTEFNWALELLTYTPIPRKKKFYKKDKQGYYYIPETLLDRK